MSRPLCSDSEDIVRAFRSSDWDPKRKRWSSDLFKGPDTSVCRLSISSLPTLFEVFISGADGEQALHRPPKHCVLGAGEIRILALKEIAEEVATAGAEPQDVRVEQDPTPGNPAHAEIVGKRSRGFAHAIIRKLKLHAAPSEHVSACQEYGDFSGQLDTLAGDPGNDG